MLIACMVSAGAAAHVRAPEIEVATLDGRGEIRGAGAAHGLCAEPGDCSPRSADVARWRPALTVEGYDLPANIVKAIDAASAVSKVEFDYLLRAAALESSFNPELEAATSSAAGLYQFVEQSWLFMMQETGAELGFEDLANAISTGEGGKYEVTLDEVREEILRLRYDAEMSAIFAGLFTRRNFEALAQMIEREPDASELYLAHVMGAWGAAEMIQLVETKPDAKANRHFRRAARANRSIFFHKNRKPRTVAEVYEVLTGKYRNIPVRAEGNEPWVSAPLVPAEPRPARRIGGEEIPYAMR
jgi:hypothetical protein